MRHTWSARALQHRAGRTKPTNRVRAPSGASRDLQRMASLKVPYGASRCVQDVPFAACSSNIATRRAGRPFCCGPAASTEQNIGVVAGAAHVLDVMTTHIIMAARHVLGLQQHRVKIGVLAARALVCGVTNIRTWATSTSVSTPGHPQGRNLLLHQVSALDACSAAAR